VNVASEKLSEGRKFRLSKGLKPGGGKTLFSVRQAELAFMKMTDRKASTTVLPRKWRWISSPQKSSTQRKKAVTRLGDHQTVNKDALFLRETHNRGKRKIVEGKKEKRGRDLLQWVE